MANMARDTPIEDVSKLKVEPDLQDQAQNAQSGVQVDDSHEAMSPTSTLTSCSSLPSSTSIDDHGDLKREGSSSLAYRFSHPSMHGTETAPGQPSEEDIESTGFEIANVQATQQSVTGVPKSVTDISKLESEVTAGLQLLDQLAFKLSSYDQQRFHAQLRQIKKIERRSDHSSVKIGIVGATGAGKSSLVNALLDEVKFVPTSCWRACTAVVTEISYNHDKNQAYRAVVNFIDQASWEEELKVLLAEIMEKSENPGLERSTRSSEALIAWDKLHAVYPTLREEEIDTLSLEVLMKHENVADIFNQQKTFEDATSAKIYQSLQKFIDSKDRGHANKTPAYWPLIKSVELFSPSELLKSGVVLVDLPGVHDNNRARSSVAQDYLKQCSHIWIVAPLIRAVDDKSAKDLLGQAFKRQLALDGNIAAITFICSKSDDIGPQHEVANSFGISDQLSGFDSKRARLAEEIRDLSLRCELAEKEREQVDEEILAIDTDLEVYENLADQCAETGSVLEPRVGGRRGKRKREDCDVANSEACDKANEPPRKRLTREDVSLKLAYLNNRRGREGRADEELTKEIEFLKEEIHLKERECEEIEAKKWRLCVTARNEAARRTIRSDFVQGIREYDQSIAEEAEDINVPIQIRDYDELERQLPVFCVSSRGYQRLCGYLNKDRLTDSFNGPRQTEIPELKAHATTLGKATIEYRLRKHNVDISRILNSLKLWSSSDTVSARLSDEELRQEVQQMEQAAQKLKIVLEQRSKDTISSIHQSLKRNIFSYFPIAQEKAEHKALQTFDSWGLKRDEGGLHYCTYKATIRRGGVFAGSAGLRDFNDQLAKPMVDKLAYGWVRCFQTNIPSITNHTKIVVAAEIDEFHRTNIDKVKRMTSHTSILEVLQEQVGKHKEKFDNLFNSLRANIAQEQKDANRGFVAKIAKEMQPGFDNAAQACGLGAFKRMKQALRLHLEAVKDTMFRSATQRVQRKLNEMIKTNEMRMSGGLQAAVDDLQYDYLNVFASQMTTLTMQDRRIRSEIHQMIGEYEGKRQPSQSADSSAIKVEAIETST